jgi:hypothetical protein
MGARREALQAARRLRLSPLLSRPDLDALERGLHLLDELCGSLPRSPERPLIGPAEIKDLSILLPELNRLMLTKEPLWVQHLCRWRLARKAHSEMAARLRIAFASGYLPVDPLAAEEGVPWDPRDLQGIETVCQGLPPQFRKLRNIRTIRLLPLAAETHELQALKDLWRRTPDGDKSQVTARLPAVKDALRVRVVEEMLPRGLPEERGRSMHIPGELVAITKLRGLRGAAALGMVYALAQEHYRQDDRERILFDQRLERALRRERMAAEPVRAYALAVTAFAVAPALVEERWPKTHNHMLDRFDTSLSAFDGGALLRPAMEALLALR